MGGNGNGEGKKVAGLGAATKQAGSKPTGQRAQSGGAPPHPARRSPAAEPATTTTQPGPGGGPLWGGGGPKEPTGGRPGPEAPGATAPGAGVANKGRIPQLGGGPAE